MANIIKSQSEIAKSMIHSLRERVNPRRNSTSVVLLDISGSMAQFTNSEITRMEALKNALNTLSKDGISFRLFAFSDDVEEISVEHHLEPTEGTDLAKALRRMLQEPISVLTIITDGEPNSRKDALNEARKLTCPINVVFVGNENDRATIEFCKQLANQHNGQFAANYLGIDSMKMLPRTLKLMLSDGRPSIAL